MPPAASAAPAAGPFLTACLGRPHEVMPVWFMRQAGRSLPEYREIRRHNDFREVVRTPELAAEVTLQPIRRYDVDAAILFSDIVTPLAALGIGVEIRPGVGPVVDRPFRRAADLERLPPLTPDEHIPYVLETIRLLAEELTVPLIGFAGGPFTLASYLVEGGPSKHHARTKALMFSGESTWARLMQALSDICTATLRAQVAAGAQAVQLFDSWVGVLSPGDYRRYVLPYSRQVFAGLADLEVPRIHFGVTTGELLDLMAEAGADVVGVDWRVPLDVARARIPEGTATQGNLDPAACLGGFEQAAAATRDVLRRAGARPDHVFNLGHGVLPDTDPGVLADLVDLVHEEGLQARSEEFPGEQWFEGVSGQRRPAGEGGP